MEKNTQHGGRGNTYPSSFSEMATRTQRLINGHPVDKNSPLIMIGGDETYEARCYDCWELPDIKTENRKRGFKLLNFQSK